MQIDEIDPITFPPSAFTPSQLSWPASPAWAGETMNSPTRGVGEPAGISTLPMCARFFVKSSIGMTSALGSVF